MILQHGRSKINSELLRGKRVKGGKKEKATSFFFFLHLAKKSIFLFIEKNFREPKQILEKNIIIFMTVSMLEPCRRNMTHEYYQAVTQTEILRKKGNQKIKHITRVRKLTLRTPEIT